MTKLARTPLNTVIGNTIYTNPNRNIKGNTARDRYFDIVDSTLNIISDANVNGGYLGIDSVTGLVPITRIKKATPTGQFLRDDGSWQTVSTATPALTAVLTAGNVMNNGQFITSQNGLYKGTVNDTYSEFGYDDGAGVVIGTGVINNEAYLYYDNGTNYGEVSVSALRSFVTHSVQNLYQSPLHEFTGDEVDMGMTVEVWVKGGSTNRGELYLTDGQAEIYTTVGGFFVAEGIVITPNYVQIKAAQTTYKHSVKNNFDSPLHSFNNTITLDGLAFTYDGNSEGLVNITTGNDYGGITCGDQYVMLNYNTGYVEIFSSSTVKMKVDKDNGNIRFYAPYMQSNATLRFDSGQGIDTTATGGSDILNIGATNANVINYGNSTTIHNFLGTAIYELQVNSYVTDKLITLNAGGSGGSAVGVGFEAEAGGVIVAYIKTNAAQTGYSFKSADTSYYADLIFTNFTANRTIAMPDASGTLAIAGDVTTGLALKADKTNTVLLSYLEIPEQTAPGTPTNAIRFFADTSNRFAWKGENGFIRTFDGTANTADRAYVLPDVSGTLALISQTITDGVTTSSPSEDVVFDALALKLNKTASVFGSYLEIPEQSAPGTPTNALRLYADSSNRFAWIGENGYTRTFDGTGNTANRIYVLPDAAGEVYLGKKTVQTLTDGATITWDVSLGQNATVTLGGNRALAISNPVAGEYYTLKVVQDGTGSRTMSLPATSKVVSGGAGAITLTTTASAIDILTCYYDGTVYYWTYGNTFS